jgi:hypothetical protein
LFHHRHRNLLVCFLFLFLLSLGGKTLATQPGLKRSGPAKPDAISGEVLRGKTVILGGKASSNFQQNVTYDQEQNSYRVSYRSAIYQLEAELDSALRVRYSKWQTMSAELIECLGYDRRITEYLPQKEALQITYYHGDKVKEKKVVAYDEQTFDSDIIYLYLPQVLEHGQERTSCDVIIKSRGWKLSVVFSPITTTDVLGLSPQYAFLDGFREFAEKIAEEDEELEVLVMDLNGLSRLFYPHRYYLAFKRTTPRQFVAYWGGAPGEAEFTFIE